MIGNYSKSFRPQISILNAGGDIDTQTSFTVFMTLIRGQFLGSLALSSKFERAPGVISKAVIVDETHAKVTTVNGRANFDGIVVAGSPGDNFHVVFTRCHVGSNLTHSISASGGEICQYIDPTITVNTRRSNNFSVTNSDLFSMEILATSYPAGQDANERLITLSDLPLHFSVRL